MEVVARALITHLAESHDLTELQQYGKTIQRQAAAAARKPLSKVNWDKNFMDYISRCVIEVYGRPLLLFKVQNRSVQELWVPESAKGHASPIMLCQTGWMLAAEHYDCVVQS